MRYARSSGPTAATRRRRARVELVRADDADARRRASSASTTTAGSQSSTSAASRSGAPGSAGTATAPSPRRAEERLHPGAPVAERDHHPVAGRRRPASRSAPAARAEASESSENVHAPELVNDRLGAAEVVLGVALDDQGDEVVGGPCHPGRRGSTASASASVTSGGTREGSTRAAWVTPAAACASSVARRSSGAATMPVESSQRRKADGRGAEVRGLGRHPRLGLGARGHGEHEGVEAARERRQVRGARTPWPRAGAARPPRGRRRRPRSRRRARRPCAAAAGRGRRARSAGRPRAAMRARWAAPRGRRRTSPAWCRGSARGARCAPAGRERHVVGAVLGHVGAGAEAEDQPALGDHVDDRRHLGRERGGPVAGGHARRCPGAPAR